MIKDSQGYTNQFYKQYKIMNDGVCLGHIQYHNIVKEPYYIAWKEEILQTKLFDTWNECIEYLKS